MHSTSFGEAKVEFIDQTTLNARPVQLTQSGVISIYDDILFESTVEIKSKWVRIQRNVIEMRNEQTGDTKQSMTVTRNHRSEKTTGTATTSTNKGTILSTNIQS